MNLTSYSKHVSVFIFLFFHGDSYLVNANKSIFLINQILELEANSVGWWALTNKHSNKKLENIKMKLWHPRVSRI
uniref:Uncharacterized protein n=1 Tax=Nelumbo nucifera TaxID=4432 RepID=A0A822Z6A9_NELNU|nr:TPA_asm: hypothetical protein HUJ06_014915 [Nelumbo nucifera]